MLIVGVRLEHAQRHSALVVVRRNERVEGEFDRKRLRWPTVTSYDVPHIERFGRGQRLGEVVDAIAALMGRLEPKPTLLVDITDTGHPPIDLMRACDLAPIPVVVTESGRPHAAHRTMHIPRQHLVTELAILLGARRLTIARKLPDAELMARQLEEYRVKPEPDDATELAISAALCCWWGQNRVRSQVKQPPWPADPVRPKGLGEMTWDEVLQISY